MIMVKYSEFLRMAQERKEYQSCSCDLQHYKEDPSWIYVQITPKELYYFDTRYFDEERQIVPLEIFQ